MLKKKKKDFVVSHRYFGMLQLENDSAIWPSGDGLSQGAQISSWEIYKDIDRVQNSIASK
ncbi:hypothetical protein BH11CYA1_BH11CYA1_16400 [soil metagenome]